MIDMQTFELFEREEYPFDNHIFIWKSVSSRNLDSNNWKYNLNHSIFSPNLENYLDYDSKSKKYSIKKSIDGSLIKDLP